MPECTAGKEAGVILQSVGGNRNEKSSEIKTATETKAAATDKGRNKSPDLIRSKSRDKSSGFYRSKAAAVSQTKAASSAYDNIAVSKVSGSVNIRTEANTSSSITGKIYNDCAATILDTVDGEGENGTRSSPGSVTGYIKPNILLQARKQKQRQKK